MSVNWDDDSAPAPEPNPTPAPTPAAQPTSWLGAAVELVMLAGCVLGVWTYFTRTDPTPAPTPEASTTSLAKLGKAYVPSLGAAYGQAWLDGAKILDAGKTVPEAIAAVSKSWDANRSALLAKEVGPAFAAIVPESADDKDVTAAKKAALAKAFRDFASGLGAK